MHGLPHTSYPLGWFQIGWPEDFAVGEPKPLRYFGCDLVGYRGESGELHVLDAHCPHMGAHLGYGGTVRGETIECPFHGWRWGADGANLAIPGASRPNRAQRIPCWEVRENSGIVLMWFHPDGEPPAWEVPTLVAPTDSFYPPFAGSQLWNVAMPPQVVAENAVDNAHFQFVHRASATPTIVSFEDRGPNFTVKQEIVYGGDKPRTWLTPDGPVTGALDINLWGVGLALTRFSGSDNAYNLVGTTPVDETTSDFRMTNWVPRQPGDDGDELPERAGRRVDEQVKQAERDINIWSHMRYVSRPPLTRDEARSYRALRRWSDRFYPASPASGDAALVRSAD